MEAEDEAQQRLDQLQSEVEDLRGQLHELEQEKEMLMKQIRSMEDRQVRNWKWIQDATKFSGVSVNKCSPKSCTFHFHPMWKSVRLQTYSMTVEFTKKGYDVGQCFLPESIHVPDLENSKPLNRLVWDISNLVDCFVHRQQQIKELEEEFGENNDRTITYSQDTLNTQLRVRVSDEDNSSFIIIIHLSYHADEILPFEVVLEFEDKQAVTDADIEDFDSHCHPFYQRPLLDAFHEAF